MQFILEIPVGESKTGRGQKIHQTFWRPSLEYAETSNYSSTEKEENEDDDATVFTQNGKEIDIVLVMENSIIGKVSAMKSSLILCPSW